jgi:Ca2+-binding EF-hand superfamily protein
VSDFSKKAHKNYLSQQKIPKITSKLDLEASLAQIQTKLRVYNRAEYDVPDNVSVAALDKAWNDLENAEKMRGQALRDHMFKFITKTKGGITPEQLKEWESAYNHFDKDNSGSLDKLEFKAALSALSIDIRNEEKFNQLFLQVSGGADRISKAQFIAYLTSLNEDKDNAEAIKGAFATIAENPNSITRNQLQVHPLNSNEQDYLAQRMPADGGALQYAVYTDSCFSGDGKSES